MEQHPVPQQISSYEFRLVGDMTLKQFAQVAGGALLALLFYASPLPGFLKWPLVIFWAFAGLALAFLPFEERPLTTWVIAFLKAVYSPTQFLWRKRGQKLEIFEEKAVAKIIEAAPKPVVKPAPPPLAESLAQEEGQILPEEEQKFLNRIQELFSVTEAPPLPPQPQVSPAYSPRLPTGFDRWRQRKAQEAHFVPQASLPSLPTLPNVLVGMVVGAQGKLVEGAILEIRDSQGNPVRALRTNKLGQFQIVSPLPNDTYEIEVEKEGLSFAIIKVELKGEIVKPMEIRAK